MNSRCFRIEPFNKVEVVDWLQCLLVFENYELIRVNDLFKFLKELFVNIIQVDACDHRTELINGER